MKYYCRPAEEWTLVMFDKMQHYLARLCWDNTVATCMAHIPRYGQIVTEFQLDMQSIGTSP